ncbi:cell division protein FtsZ [Alsobacter metallidurans]|uniref:Cell division protein FtsZ n=1 Tax=Alsobacter metallidurans TaxID=340221 RepID=A0A917I8X1_9HYPH|nr:cell division protein FtsZ [Alsobacter metallidurans]GGH27428.1 cell division protein FtsZ [Alsobacter metallidurans]
MTINLKVPDIRELKPRITVFGVGGAGGNAVNNMIELGLQGCEFVVGNTDAQALTMSKADRVIQMGIQVTEGLGAGSQPEVGRAAAEEVIDEIRDQLSGAHMVFVTAGMGGGTGTGSAPVVARAARDMGILTVGVVTKPFQFEGARRMRLAESGINELQKAVDTLIVIPNQNLFRVANEQTTFADAFAMADRVLYSGVACITDLMVKEGLINLDFADVRAVMREMGKAMMGTGEATGEKRAMRAAEAAIANPLLDDVCMKGARGLLISITGGSDLTLYEVDEAATRIREEVDQDANVIFGATRDDSLEGIVRVSVVATGIDSELLEKSSAPAMDQGIAEVAERLRTQVRTRHEQMAQAQARAVPRIETQQPEPAQAPAPAYAEPAAPAITHNDVTLRPAQPKAAVYEPMPEAPRAPMQEPAPQPTSFIPPRAEEVVRPPRMPRVDELPLPGQRMMQDRAPAQAQAPAPAPEKKRVTLMERLAAAGFGRREEAAAPAPVQQPAPQQRAAQPTYVPQAQPQAPAPVHQDYAKRPAPQVRAPQGGLDMHGRPTSQRLEDDQLEIPAFLRRQSN